GCINDSPGCNCESGPGFKIFGVNAAKGPIRRRGESGDPAIIEQNCTMPCSRFGNFDGQACIIGPVLGVQSTTANAMFVQQRLCFERLISCQHFALILSLYPCQQVINPETKTGKPITQTTL